MAKCYLFPPDSHSKEKDLMAKAAETLLIIGNGIITEDNSIGDGKYLYQEYSIYNIPNHIRFMYEADYVPKSKSYLVKYTVLEEYPNSKITRAFHNYAQLLEGELEKLLGLE